MKRDILFLTLTSLFLLTLVLSAVSAASASCLKSSDDYAVEVVLNKPETEYNLNYLSNAKNVILREGRYTFLSHYSNELMVVISEVDGSVSGGQAGLSIRLQMPTISSRESVHVLDIISKSIRGRIITENVSQSSYNGWLIDCTDERVISECKFINDGMAMRAYLEDSQYNVELEISQNIGSCDVDGCNGGYCVRSGGSSTCIDKNKRESAESMLKYAGLIESFNEFSSAYSIVRNGISPMPTISADLPEEESEAKDGAKKINWSEALEKELSWLKSQNIVRILNNDIEEISPLAMQGAAGQNNRIVYAKDRVGAARWIYYKDSIEPSLSLEKECGEFVISKGITGGVTFEAAESGLYYIIPIALVIIILLIFALVIVFTRWNYERKKK